MGKNHNTVDDKILRCIRSKRWRIGERDMSPFGGSEEFQKALNAVICSSRAITDVSHLKGRQEEVAALARVLVTPGRQPFIHGLRGV